MERSSNGLGKVPFKHLNEGSIPFRSTTKIIVIVVIENRILTIVGY